MSVIYGSADENDTLSGGGNSDRIYGLGGDDRANGKNTLFGGSAEGSVYGGTGNDVSGVASQGELHAGDAFYGDAGQDTLHPYQPADLIGGVDVSSIEAIARSGTSGNDQINGINGVSRNLLYGLNGLDTILPPGPMRSSAVPMPTVSMARRWWTMASMAAVAMTPTSMGAAGSLRSSAAIGTIRCSLFVAGQGDILAGETCDGAAGMDTLVLQQGASIAAGVVVAGIDAIVHG